MRVASVVKIQAAQISDPASKRGYIIHLLDYPTIRLLHGITKFLFAIVTHMQSSLWIDAKGIPHAADDFGSIHAQRIDKANVPLLSIPMSELEFTGGKYAIANERLALFVHHCRVPLARFSVKINRTRLPSPVLQGSGSNVIVTGAVGRSHLIPRDISCTITRARQSAGLFLRPPRP